MSLLVPETGVGGRRPAKDTSAPTFHRPEATASRATIAPCDTPTKAIRASAFSKPSFLAASPMVLSKASRTAWMRPGCNCAPSTLNHS